MINDRYVLKKKLGEGRSAVFLCEDMISPDLKIAIKILPLHSSDEEIKTFRDEYFTLGRLRHPNIIRSLEYGAIVKTKEDPFEIKKGSQFFTQEYFEGISLLDDENLKDENYLIEILKQLCSVLFYLHQSNYIYYDLKAENVLVKISEGMPFVKMIDFGFARCVLENDEYEIRGTAEYIAPEILKKETHDHRVDLYAFGILLYKIIYGKFPFKTENELDIYKAHLEKEFEFVETHYSDKLVNVIKKLLHKNPAERYFTSIQILFDLGIDLNQSAKTETGQAGEKIKNEFMPAKVVADRKDSFNILKRYINDEQSGEVFTIKGLEDAGKTSLLYKIFYEFNNVILLRGNYSKSGVDFLIILLNKIFYNDFIYSKLSLELKENIESIFSSPNTNLNELRIIFSQISSQSEFVLLLDDFNRYDSYTIELLHEVIPILQVNRTKIILSESSDFPYSSRFINNLREIDLLPFTDVQLKEFFESSYASFFPKDDLRKTVTYYADFLPGSVINFIRDCLFFNLLVYKYDEIIIQQNDKIINLLKSSHETIYNERVQTLEQREKKLAEIISAFNINAGREILSALMNVNGNELSLMINQLHKKNIIYAPNNFSAPYYQSDGMKKFIYSSIENKDELHLKIGKLLRNNFGDVNKNEIARHFELAGDYLTSHEIIKEEIDEADRISAFSYKRKLLEHLLNFPLDELIQTELKIELTKVLFSLSEFAKAKTAIEDLLLFNLSEKQRHELIIMQGISLIKIGEAANGINLLNEIIKTTNDGKVKFNLLSETARGYLDLSNFSRVINICTEIVTSEIAAAIDKGKSFNLLGLVEIFRDNNLDGALKYFIEAETEYAKANSKFNIAEMQMNQGNIYNMIGEHDLAEEHWNKSLQTNQAVGNLEHEGRLLDNLGISHFKKLEIEKSLKEHQRALNIFLTLGNKEREAIGYVNLSEAYLLLGEYSLALNSLIEANLIFRSLKNTAEEMETLFLLSELNFLIGDENEFLGYLNKLESLIKEKDATEKEIIYQNYLRALNKLLNNKYEEALDMFVDSREKFQNLQDDQHYFRSTLYLINCLLALQKYSSALAILSDIKFAEFCKKNCLFESELNYRLGLISELDNSLNLKVPLLYFEEAFEKIKGAIVTELTWKILLKLTVHYLNRGNNKKAKDFSFYGSEIIKYFAKNIKEENLRNKFLNSSERLEAQATFYAITKKLS